MHQKWHCDTCHKCDECLMSMLKIKSEKDVTSINMGAGAVRNNNIWWVTNNELATVSSEHK